MFKTDIELKGCPFCGKEPRIRVTFDTWVVGCENKKCKVSPSTWLCSSNTDGRVETALNRWNTRNNSHNSHNT